MEMKDYLSKAKKNFRESFLPQIVIKDETDEYFPSEPGIYVLLLGLKLAFPSRSFH